MRSFLSRLFKNIEWLINPHVNDRHEIALLMRDVGLKKSHWRVRRSHHVFVDGGRLIGIYYVDLKKDLIETFLRVTIYEKDSIDESLRSKYSLCYTFYHRTNDKERFKLSSMAKTPFMYFDDVALHIRNAQVITDSRTAVYQIQQASKKVFVDERK